MLSILDIMRFTDCIGNTDDLRKVGITIKEHDDRNKYNKSVTKHLRNVMEV